MKYLKEFQTHVQYEAYTADTANFVTPNVSLCDQENDVHYSPHVKPLETRVVTKYNVTSTSYATSLITGNEQNIFKSMEIDGVLLDNIVTEYTFDTVGLHTVKYELYDETKLGNQAPLFQYQLVECVIPDSVTTIGNNTFSNCSNLTSVNIPSGVTSIGDGAFNNCTSITSVNIPSGVTTIGNSTFYNCRSLTSIDIPSGVTSIGTYAFSNCSGVTTCIIPSGITIISNGICSGCTSLTSVTIPNSATSIGNSAFSNCSGLTSIDIPDSVTSIGDYAFYGCSGIISCTIGSGATSIGSNAFRSCGITDISIPSGVTSFGSWVFGDCSSLTSVTIPDSITDVGYYIFAGCDSLPVENNIRYADTYAIVAIDKTLTTYTLKNNTRFIGAFAFSGCTNLTNITIPNSVIYIDTGVFDNCDSLPVENNIRYADTCAVTAATKTLSSYVVKEGTKFIYESCFSKCSNATSIVIPNSVIEIGDFAFSRCSHLTSITVEAITPPLAKGRYIFYESDNCTIYVPSGSVNAYKAADGWSDVASRIQAMQ